MSFTSSLLEADGPAMVQFALVMTDPGLKKWGKKYSLEYKQQDKDLYT